MANKIINGKQRTILCHMGNFKTSHEDYSVIRDIITKINKELGKEEPLTVTKGLVHEYLGMTIEYRKKVKVQISMLKYIDEILDEAPKYFNVTAVTTSANHLFKVN